MFSLYRTLSLRHLRRRWSRAALIVASIALGVATLVATRALNATMAQAMAASTNPLAGVVDLVVSNGELTVPRSLADEIAAVPGVRSVDAKLFGHARLVDGAERRNVLVLGVALDGPRPDFAQADRVTLSPGTEAAFAAARLLGQTPAVVGAELARDLPADAALLTLEQHGTTHTLVKAGTLTATGDLAVLGGYVVVLEQQDAATVLGTPPGQVQRLDVLLQPNADPAATRQAIEKIVAGRALVQTPLEQGQSSSSAMGGMRAGFALCGVAALIVGMFLVYNALSVSVAERRPEIGILRAIGATRSQIRWLFTGEAALLGLLGGLLGLPLGVGFAYLGLQPMQHMLSDLFANVRAGQVEVSPGLAVLAVAVGVVSALVASLVPALQAARERPIEAARRVAKAASARHLLLQFALSLGLVLAGVALILARAALPPRWGTFGGLSLVLIGALAAAPVFAAAGAYVLQPLARRCFPLAWRLAADNLVRSPGRTGLVIGALAAGVALVTQTAGVIQSNRLAIREWVETAFLSDLIVTSGTPLGSGAQVAPMDEAVGAELTKLPAVAAALPSRFRKVPFRNVRVALLAVEADDIYRLNRPRRDAPDLELYRKLAAQPDAALVSENFAALHRVGVGDTLTLPGPDGPVALRVLGTLVDYSWNLGTVIVNRRDYVHHWHDARADVFDVYLHPGHDPRAVKEQVAARFGVRYQLQPMTRAELTAAIDGMVERIYGIAYGQQVVVMLVAALGVVTSLLISVLQRRRELGLLRALGAPRGQVLHSVLAEACLMGLLGTGIGVLVGIPMQWYVLQVVLLEEAGLSFPVSIPWAASALVALVALSTATLAGLGPALHAVRQRIPDAIAYE